MRAVSVAAQPRADSAAIATPGDAFHAFWLALTTRSTPISMSNGIAPRPLMPSTSVSGWPGAARTVESSSASGFTTPVEVSLWVISTARYGSAPSRCSASAAGSALAPHSAAKVVTSAP